MKNIIRLLLLAVALTAFSGAVSAQSSKQRLSREQLAEVQAKHIAKEMAMDEATSQCFIETLPVSTGHLGTRPPSEKNAQSND